MSRTGYLVVGALIFALAAAGVLVWTNYIDLSGKPSVAPADTVPVSTPTSQPSSREAQLVTQMNEAAAGGGFVASFLEADVRKWQIGQGHRLERFSLDPSGPVFARLTSSTPLDKVSVEWPSLGLSMALPVEFANLANGRTVEIGFIARSAQSNGSPELSVIYATQQAGNSLWRAIELKPTFEAYKFTFDVPKVDSGYINGPIVVFHSDATGNGRAVEMIGAYVKLVP
jgi:hypothetical protein